MMLRLLHVVASVGQLALWALLLGFAVLVAVPRFTPYDLLIVRGASMQPSIPVGSVVIVDRADRVPRLGVVATFNDPSGEFVTHRIVGFDGAKIVTKGDANQARDVTERTSTDLVGTVVVGIPILGYVLYALSQPLVFFLLLVGTGGFLIVGELQTIVREIRRLRRARAA
jgi:signal peptidase I